MTTIKQFLSVKNNKTYYQWVILGLAEGDLNKVKGFSDLDGHSKGLISIYKAKVIKAAKEAGIDLIGKELATDFYSRLKNNLDKPIGDGIASALYGVDEPNVH